MTGIIGFSVSILGFLLHQIIDIISEFKWELTSFYIQKQDFPGAFTFTVGYSLIFLVASCILVLYQPAAAGSGIPEIIGFLNGTRIKDIFKLQAPIVKSSFSHVPLQLDFEYPLFREKYNYFT